MKTLISKGRICIKGPCDFIYAVCNLTYVFNEDESFQYVFEPNYYITDLLNTNYFQGIPGLNLDLKEKKYIRDNRIPTFISERVPSEKREDFYELLSQVGLEYLDPIEYLIRAKDQYSGDKLFVLPYKEKETISFDNYFGNKTNTALMKDILINICFGNDIVINGHKINDENRKIFHDIFINFYSRSSRLRKESQAQGISRAKKAGKYKGRKPIQVDEIAFFDVLSYVERKKLTPKEAANQLGISIDKYYRLKNKLRK